MVDSIGAKAPTPVADVNDDATFGEVSAALMEGANPAAIAAAAAKAANSSDPRVQALAAQVQAKAQQEPAKTETPAVLGAEASKDGVKAAAATPDAAAAVEKTPEGGAAVAATKTDVAVAEVGKDEKGDTVANAALVSAGSATAKVLNERAPSATAPSAGRGSR